MAKKRKARKKNAPKPGEVGYLSPTQLRNARKRRAKKISRSAEGSPGDRTTSGNKRHRPPDGADPSLKFLRNPEGAPIVQTARRYLEAKLSPSSSDGKYTNARFRVYLGPTKQWRTVAKLAVRPHPSGQGVAIGLFRPGTHDVVSVSNCTAHHDSINAAVRALTKICGEKDVSMNLAFDDITGQGFLRYVALSVERATGAVQLCLVWNSVIYPKRHDGSGEDDEGCNDEGRRKLLNIVRELKRFHGNKEKRTRRRGKKGRGQEGKNEPSLNNSSKTASSGREFSSFSLHSLWVHYNSTWKHGNAIFDTAAPAEAWEHLCGPRYIEEILDLTNHAPPMPNPVKLRFPPNVFRQANIDAFTTIVGTIRRMIHRYSKEERERAEGSTQDLPTCLELYGGVGTIGLNMVDLTSSLTSSDENPHNYACFQGSAAESLPNELRERLTYVPRNATDVVAGGHGPIGAEILVVDPPRKGLDRPVLDFLCKEQDAAVGPKLLTYISCGFDAFQRDADALLDSGKWRIYHAEGHLLFPGSDAIETLAFFARTSMS